MAEEIIPVVMFIVMGFVLALFFYYRYRGRVEVQSTIRLALEKGNELTPELLDRMAESKGGSSKERDLRRGMVSMGIGTACALFGFILGEDDAVRPLIAIGMFPLLVGIAYLVLWYLARRED